MFTARYIGNNEKPVELLKLARDERSSIRAGLAKKIHALRRRLRTAALARSNAMLQTQSAKVMLNYERAYHDVVARAHADCLQVALDIAQEVIAAEMTSNIEGMRQRVSEKLSSLMGTRPLAVRIHPSDQLLLQGTNLPIIPDSELSRGSITIETSSGRVEIDCMKHFDALAREIQSKLKLALPQG